MEESNAALQRSRDSEIYSVSELDLDSLKSRAEGRLSWGNVLGQISGVSTCALGMFLESWPFLFFGLVVLAEPRFFKTKKSAATLELIRRLEERVAMLETNT